MFDEWATISKFYESDKIKFILKRDLMYRTLAGSVYVVPKGTISDLGSIPRLLWGSILCDGEENKMNKQETVDKLKENEKSLWQWIAEQGGQSEKGPEFIQYDIYPSSKEVTSSGILVGSGYWMVDVPNLQPIPLYTIITSVGFAGVQFKDFEGWHPEVVKFDADGLLPLTPEKVRFLK